MTPTVILFQWSGRAMVPVRRFADHCAAVYKVGDHYHMEVQQPRRESSHRHYFAALDEAWSSLPHEFDLEPWAQSREHLRHYSLIRCGWFNSIVHQCASNAEAVRWAAIMRPNKPFAIVTAVRSTVVEQSAVSQQRAAMGAKDFMKSKWQVLDFVADLIGTTRGELEAAALKSAQ
jgi:hypothetical protein